LTDLGKNFGADEDNYSRSVKTNTFYPTSALDIDNDTNEQLFQRKKAWADLEREQEDVKSNIKTLMRRDPGSTEIENPLFADRVNRKTTASNYKVPQDVILEEKHQKQMNNIKEGGKKERPSTSNDDYTSSSRREKATKTKSGALNRDSSNE
jgi:hypothetical protein